MKAAINKVTSLPVGFTTEWVVLDNGVWRTLSADEFKLAEAEQAIKKESELIAHFKSLYMNIVDAKLKELDYDSLATVQLWEGDAVFGDEATAILGWYKSIISYNYEVLNEVKLGNREVPTDEEYLAGMPVL